MTKRFFKDNRGQVLYAVIVAVMFIGLLSMTAMGLTLKNYQASLQKQERVADYYAADAVAELIRLGKTEESIREDWEIDDLDCEDIDAANGIYKYAITCGSVTIVTEIDTVNQEFHSWEVSYHAVQTQAGDQ